MGKAKTTGEVNRLSTHGVSRVFSGVFKFVKYIQFHSKRGTYNCKLDTEKGNITQNERTRTTKNIQSFVLSLASR